MYNPQLDAFVQVADCGSFNKAAEALYLSSTAVIKQINALEKHLDLQLVFRTNHGITLTEAGKVLSGPSKRPAWRRKPPPPPSAWAPPSSTPASPSWTCGTR